MSTTTDQPYAGAFREWWLRRSFYAKNFLILDAIALFVLMIALVVNAATATSTSTVTSESSSGTSYSYSYSVDSEFLNDVHQRPFFTQNWSDAELVRGAQWVCDQRDLGFSETYVMAEEDRIMSSYDAGYFVGAAERAYCSQHYLTSRYGY